MKTFNIYRKEPNCRNSAFSDERGLQYLKKKKVCLAGTLPETTEIKSGERWLEKAKPLLEIPYFYLTNLEAHNCSLRKTIWKALLQLKQKDYFNLSVFSSACNYGQVSIWPVQSKPLNASTQITLRLIYSLVKVRKLIKSTFQIP